MVLLFRLLMKFLRPIRNILIALVTLCVTGAVFADTPITIDGIKYTKYALVSNTVYWAYKDLQQAINSGYNVIIVDDGTYYLSGTTTVRRNGILITGISKETSKIVETNPNKDLLQIYANNVTVKNLTLDTKTYNAQAAFVVGDGVATETTNETLAGNNITLTKCNILGGNKIFALFFAGPTYKTKIYDKYSANKLNTGNIITNNYFEGTYSRDAFVFALQKNGTIQNNTFSGGELDVYMNYNTLINNNTIKNSNKTGIYLSGPSNMLTLSGNTINTTKEHGIKSYYQIDNEPIPEGSKYILNSKITGNILSNIGETGIDLNYFVGGTIQNNSITNSAVHGISLISYSSDNVVLSNTINLFGQAKRFRGSGIFVTVNSARNEIRSNQITTDTTQQEYAGIFIETADSIRNALINNTINGSFAYAGVYSYTTDTFLSQNYITNTSGPAILYVQ